ncbi:MAG: S24/S26 family peptidase [Paludibacteraceae bacterium]|nr:S24/S26 family peptidase [Paludibacteraceae bacterium]
MQLPNEIFIPEIARLVADGKQVVFTPTGVSMRPYIEGGVDNVTLVRPTDPQVGDIVLAEIQPQHYVLHRIYALQGEAVTLMGDGNLQGEEHCSRSNILAKVTAIHSPKGKSKPVTKAWLWRHILPLRRILLKIYRHTCI